MLNKLFPYISSIGLILTYSCNKNPNDELLDIYHQKSEEIVAFVLSKTEYCKCILEPPIESILDIKKREMPEMDTIYMRKEIMDRLGILRHSTLDSMLVLSLEFDLRKSIKDPSIKIIGREVRDTITTRKSYDMWMNSILEICPEGLCYAERPIFNPDFKLVSFDIDYAGSLTRTLEYKNGKWTCEDSGWY